MMSETYSSSAHPKYSYTHPSYSSAHPSYREMISAAVKAYKRPSGASRQEILKYITSYYNLGEKLTSVRYQLKLALKAGVKDGSLKQTKGTGANGSFRLGKMAQQNNKAKTVQATKPTAAKNLLVPSKTLDDHQKILPQPVRPVALCFVKSQEFDFKGADLQSINLQKNSPADAPIHKGNLPDNVVIHNVSIKSVINSPKTFTAPDAPIQKGDLPDNGVIHNVSIKSVNSPKTFITAPYAPIQKGDLPENVVKHNLSIENVNSPKTFTTPDALQDNEPPDNENAEVSKRNVESQPKTLPSQKPRYLKRKQKVASKPLIKTTHPIIPESSATRRNCKLCYSKWRKARKCRTRCYTCETYLCFFTYRNCLLEFHKK
ncbi:unnamed protein product [Lymnaea stagnalis]|uniref:H15 domain-containing protein n=1 Tax=Lymnaea stagnalis TaxID=6523 RepID=A0AAV2ICP1_LYMST